MRKTKTTLGMLVVVSALAAMGVTPPFLGVGNAQSLQEELSDLEVGNHWRYNDWEGARAAAEKEKKPIFVLFR